MKKLLVFSLLVVSSFAIAQKVKFEKEYLLRKSFWFDLKIMVLTFTSVLKSDGVKH